MVFYLTGGSKIVLYYTPSDVVYMEYADALQAPRVETVRWKSRSVIKSGHLEGIVEYLKSGIQADRDIGRALLEKTLNVKIHQMVIGYDINSE